MKIEELTMEDLKRGYTDDFKCVVCDREFKAGEVYPIQDRFFDAQGAAAKHVKIEHEDYLMNMINLDSKYNTLTKKQREVLALFADGMKDKEIADELSLSTSTIRQLRFQFREKAKQAKLYLAIYESVFESEDEDDSIIPVHAKAKMVDDRFIVTEKERREILDKAFSSYDPLTLTVFPRKEKKKVVILTKIADEFDRGEEYSEKDVNEIIQSVFNDYTTIRRYLIDYGFLERTPSGSKYWLAK